MLIKRTDYDESIRFFLLDLKFKEDIWRLNMNIQKYANENNDRDNRNFIIIREYITVDQLKLLQEIGILDENNSKKEEKRIIQEIERWEKINIEKTRFIFQYDILPTFFQRHKIYVIESMLICLMNQDLIQIVLAYRPTDLDLYSNNNDDDANEFFLQCATLYQDFKDCINGSDNYWIKWFDQRKKDNKSQQKKHPI